ncbi:MAG: hypothetical protein ACE364_09635 [Chlorobiota bacterium]
MDEKKLKVYDDLVTECNRFERKGKTMPYTSANGHMFSLFNKDNQIGIRFGKEKQEEYIQKYNSDYYKSYGALMRGYILITEDMLKDKSEIIKLLNESYDYVMSLPSK